MALQTVRAANLDKRKRIGNEGRRGAARLGKVAREARRREAAEGVEEAAEGRARPAGRPRGAASGARHGGRADQGCGPRKGCECVPPRAGGRSPAPARLSFKPPSLPPFASPTRSGPGPPRPLFPSSPWVSEASPRPWGASTLRCEGRRHPLPQLPRVEPLAFPSVPATLRHYRQPSSSTADPAFPIGRRHRQSHAHKVGLAEI